MACHLFQGAERAAVEEGAEAGVAGATDGKLFPVGENSHVAIFRVGLDLHDPLAGEIRAFPVGRGLFQAPGR
jgi:hypothetical protein